MAFRFLSQTFVCAFLASTAVVAIAGCASDATEATQQSQDEVKTTKHYVYVSQRDANKTVTVAEGKVVRIELPYVAGTAYRWEVTGVDRSFGYPYKTKYVTQKGKVGGSGKQRLFWKTRAGGFSVAGKHRVTLTYKPGFRAAEADDKTFTVTINVKSPVVDGCKSNDDCGSGQYCSACWGHLACIPKGALC